MAAVLTRVVGGAGPAVLLLPGGAETVAGFFPGLAEGLLADPGCRLVLHDRPGTGTAETEGTLREAADDLHATLAELGVGPVVVVGQSLGGAVAALLACAHPDDVAGLVLLDPSVINDAALGRRLEQGARTTARLARVPVVGRVVPALLRASVAATKRRHDLRPDAVEALELMRDVDVDRLARAAHGFADLARDFDESRLPRVPAVVVTADRKPTSAVRRAHQRLASALDAPLVSWPGAEHAVHLTHPDEVLGACRDVVREVG